MDDETRAALSDQATWLRLPVMLLFYLLLVVAAPLLIVVSAVGWLIRLFTGEQPDGVVEFGQTIGKWFRRCSDYLCGAAERRPFPFEDHDCPSDRAAVEASGPQGSRTGGAGERTASASSGSPAPAPKEVSSGPASEVDEKAVATRKASKKKATRKKAAKKKSRGKKASSKKTAAKKKTQAGTPSDKDGSE